MYWVPITAGQFKVAILCIIPTFKLNPRDEQHLWAVEPGLKPRNIELQSSSCVSEQLRLPVQVNLARKTESLIRRAHKE
jgi:hypothetical protein